MTYLSYYKSYEKGNYQNKGNGLKLFSAFLLEPSPISAYLLGYLWADAYIAIRNGIPDEIRLEIVKKDADYLIPLFESLGEISTYTRHRANRQPQTTIRLSSPILSSILVDLGLTKGRLDCTKVVNTLPTKLKRFFLLGLFDGDGCLYISKDNKLHQFCISACKEQNWSWITHFVSLACSVSLREQIQPHYSCVRVTGKDNLTRLGSWMYHDHELGLPRKRVKWLDMIGTPTKRQNLLTDEDSNYILEQISLGVKYKVLSEKFNVSERYISKLKMKGGYKKKVVTSFETL